MRILGIDPGYERLGIAIVEKGARGKDTLIHSECFTTDAKLAFYDRLALIRKHINEIISAYHPSVLAIETLFIQKNQKTAMRVSEARGVVAVTAAEHGLEIREFSPLQIKLAVTGDGKSDKSGVIKMMGLLLPLTSKKRHDDEYDAIAAALTGSATAGK